MMNTWDRYAIAWLPRPGSRLARFGAAWTGWCAEAGERSPRHEWWHLPISPHEVTGSLERQGLHAIIRPSFRLSRTRWAFERELMALSERLKPAFLPRLVVSVLDGQVCLVPGIGGVDLTRFRATINRRLDAFDAKVPRHRAECAGVDEPAAPFAAERAFAMPLTVPLSPEKAERLAAALACEIEPILSAPVRITEFALIAEPGEGRGFRVVERFALQDRRSGSALPCLGPNLYTHLGAEGHGAGESV